MTTTSAIPDDDDPVTVKMVERLLAMSEILAATPVKVTPPARPVESESPSQKHNITNTL